MGEYGQVWSNTSVARYEAVSNSSAYILVQQTIPQEPSGKWGWGSSVLAGYKAILGGWGSSVQAEYKAILGGWRSDCYVKQSFPPSLLGIWQFLKLQWSVHIIIALSSRV